MKLSSLLLSSDPLIEKLNEFSIGETIKSPDGKTQLTIVDFDPGSDGSERVMSQPPSLLCRIEKPNPEYTPDNLQAAAAINEIANKTRKALGLYARKVAIPPSPTCSEDKFMYIDEFLEFMRNFQKQ
jgi:hypothetical protein